MCCYSPSSPKGRNRNSLDMCSSPGIKPAMVGQGGGFLAGPFLNSGSVKRRLSISKPNGGVRGKSRGKKGGMGEVGYLGGYIGVEDGFDGLGSPMSDVGGDSMLQMNGLAGEGDEVRLTLPGDMNTF